MLFGISLLVGVLGTAHLPTMAAAWPACAGPAGADRPCVLVLGGLMLMVGLAFKLSAVPFHFWAPDVFEGARPKWRAFLSVASKAAALGLLVRLALTFSRRRRAPAARPRPVRLSSAAWSALLAAVTCTFGNLAAYGQTNMKRLLAYSTIAHAGYMMMPVAAAVPWPGDDAAEPADRRGRGADLPGHLPVHESRRLRGGRLPPQRTRTAKPSTTTPA